MRNLIIDFLEYVLYHLFKSCRDFSTFINMKERGTSLKVNRGREMPTSTIRKPTLFQAQAFYPYRLVPAEISHVSVYEILKANASNFFYMKDRKITLSFVVSKTIITCCLSPLFLSYLCSA